MPGWLALRLVLLMAGKQPFELPDQAMRITLLILCLAIVEDSVFHLLQQRI